MRINRIFIKSYPTRWKGGKTRNHGDLNIYPENRNKYTLFSGNEFIGNKRLVSR